MLPGTFSIIGIISIAFGLGTPPYGLCLMFALWLGRATVRQAIRDTLALLAPMRGVLIFVIIFPDATLALPRRLMPKFVHQDKYNNNGNEAVLNGTQTGHAREHRWNKD